MKPQTLRYYERRGLLTEPSRTASGYREFDETAVTRIRFIKAAQSVGFTLTEVQTLLHLCGGRQTDCQGARELARGKISELDHRIHDLRSLRRLLHTLAAQCDETTDPGHCPMLTELSEGRIGGTPR